MSLNEFAPWQCPLCGAPLAGDVSLKCARNHSFDRACGYLGPSALVPKESHSFGFALVAAKTVADILTVKIIESTNAIILLLFLICFSFPLYQIIILYKSMTILNYFLPFLCIQNHIRYLHVLVSIPYHLNYTSRNNLQF